MYVESDSKNNYPTRERVRHLKHKALYQLRDYARKRYLLKYLRSLSCRTAGAVKLFSYSIHRGSHQLYRGLKLSRRDIQFPAPHFHCVLIIDIDRAFIRCTYSESSVHLLLAYYFIFILFRNLRICASSKLTFRSS